MLNDVHGVLEAAGTGLLAAAGILLVALAILGLRQPPPRRGAMEPYFACEALSPDDSLRCNQEIGHYGWHRYGENAWFGDAWDCDHWADTQEAPIIDQEPTTDARQWNQPASAAKPAASTVKPKRRIKMPRPGRPRFPFQLWYNPKTGELKLKRRIPDSAFRECTARYVPSREEKLKSWGAEPSFTTSGSGETSSNESDPNAPTYKEVNFQGPMTDAQASAKKFAEHWINHEFGWVGHAYTVIGKRY